MSLEVGLERRTRRRKRRKRRAPLFLLLMLILVAGAGYWYFEWKPSNEQVKPYDGSKQAIVFEGELFQRPYQMEGDQILLPFEFIQEYLDPHIHWEEPSKLVIITTKDKVLRMQSGELVAYLNKKPVDLQVPVTVMDGNRYIPLAPLEKLYPYAFTRHEESGVLRVEKNGYEIQEAHVLKEKESVRLRSEPTHRSPYLAELPGGAVVDVLGEQEDYYRVLSADGISGFLPKKVIEQGEARKVTLELPKDSLPALWKPEGKRINLTWEHVVSRNPNTAEIGSMPGVNVVSPTWFELKDAEGTLANKADPAYVKWAHQRGFQVWGLVTNGFNPDWTRTILSSYDKREKVISQILHYAYLYDLDGINIDFENVYLEEKDKLVQFIRELTPYLHQQGLVVSMDVTIKSTSDMWSRFYDRKALGEVVDYMAVMTYDEHWASSPVAGSVASLPWTENGLRGVLDEVPAEKVLLGVPFYTRLWKEAKQQDGSVKVSSKALSMPTAEKWVKERKLTPQLDEASGQLFVRYQDPADGAVYKMWLEDVSSVQKRMEIVKKYNLAGAASWRRGFEQPAIWEAMDAALQGK
ncbi:glycosyl hydrolase family 18 protein [Brevibacillus ruminantium]|uniref:Glycosyl hydrolase family 18 protein n=1 Tax=Brevibacillus ruminantium TaxID=2950604 RepID=A0ABY4WHA6_9BACL|nr:glycosyl hydrolase family 18 protein [Brevibacillus ruminantium]USG64714.1 glycosyl hydrolase family 18 protein [Brevibacillus ruminantium]